MTIDELLKTSYWVIDILPAQVPKDGPGQYFAVEKYFLDEKRLAAIKEKHINLVLKLNCYRQISIDGGAGNPAPELVAAEMRKRYLHIMVDESMILSEPDDADLTIFNPDAELLDLIREIADIFSIAGIETEIICASVRNPIHVTDCALAGGDIATVPFGVLEKMINHPLTDIGIKKFQKDYIAVFGE